MVQPVSDQKGLGESNIWTLVALGEVVGGRRSDAMLGVLVIHQHVVLGALVTAIPIRDTTFYLLVLWNMEHRKGIVFIKLLEFFYGFARFGGCRLRISGCPTIGWTFLTKL